LSLAWGCLCSLPHTLGTTSSSVGNPLATKLGLTLAVTGLLTETLADYQKWKHKQREQEGEQQSNSIVPASSPSPIRSGLWSLSQHPNWFGNLMLWTGLCIVNAPALIEPNLFPSRATLMTRLWSWRRVGLAALSPLFMGYTFWGQATGRLLPDGHQATLKRYGYGVDQSYTDYIDSTPLIVPNVWQWWFGGGEDEHAKTKTIQRGSGREKQQ
jgi:hypothetical protein